MNGNLAAYSGLARRYTRESVSAFAVLFALQAADQRL